MSIRERVVQANRPGPPEHSVSFRVAAVGAVVVSLAACWHQGELGPVPAVVAMAATVAGNVLSYRRRVHPWPAVKPILAVCVVGGFVWFIATVTRTAAPGDITTVEGPLAALFAWVLATHAFDVPSRRDVAYSLAGSAALMAVAAAQTVDLSLGLFVAVWVVFGLWGLLAMWQSMSGTNGLPWRSLAVAAPVVALLTVAFVAVLPAPHVSASLTFPASSAGDSPVHSPNGLTDGGSGSLPAHAAPAGGRTGVGGFLGFARSLDTATRASLGNEVVMRVRATKPTFWIGQTYDRWDGQSWVQSSAPVDGAAGQELTGGSPFTVPPAADQVAGLASGGVDVQTFYLAQSGPNLVFHADVAERVYLVARDVYLSADGTIVSGSSMGAGTVYTVVSDANVATPGELRAASATAGEGLTASLPPGEAARYLQLPRAYDRVAALARQVTAGIGTPGRPTSGAYDKIVALEAWMASHIRYSTDIPPLAPGQDAVDQFLFGTRVGYCEQISTALTVMLRTLGIPAREAVGYVPGPYNPITDLYDVQAKDAHAWVQVWFPGYGWQSFDPTAAVPLANPSPGSVITHGIGVALARVPWIPVGFGAAAVLVAAALRRRFAGRPPTWAHRVAAGIERGGARAGVPRAAGETLASYAERLGRHDPASARWLRHTADLVDRAAYGGAEVPAIEVATAVSVARRFRPAPVRTRTGRGPRRTTRLRRAAAGRPSAGADG